VDIIDPAEVDRIKQPDGGTAVLAVHGFRRDRLRRRADALAATAEFAPYFAGFREPWLYQDAEGAADTLRRDGFLEVETSVEPALTVLDDPAQFKEFVANIILRQHLQRIPTEDLRSEFMSRLTAQAATDEPPFSLDYWRLNLRGRT
jgi:hypothetical protein